MPFIDLPGGPLPGIHARAPREERPWYRIQNVAADEAEVFLYDEVGSWYGATAEDFIAELRGITAPNILLRVNSPGGSVTEGIAIANALRSHPANVTVQVDGIAASIASVIAMAGDKVRMMPNALLMVHEASGLCVGEAADMIKMAELLDKISDNIAGAYAARAGGTEAEWRQVMKNETWYRGEEAVAAGLADEYVPVPHRSNDDAPEEPEMRKQFDLSAYGYQGPKRPEPAPTPAAPQPVAPKPAPPAAAQTLVDAGMTPQAVAEAVLSEDIRSLIGEEVAAQLAAAVQPEPVAVVEPEPAVEPVDATLPELADTASPVHHTATEDRPWDAGPNEKRLPSPMTLATAKKMYAWYDEAQVEDGELAKAACKLPHHEVSADGTPGAANLSGVRNALARLPQSDIPASQHDAVRRHLQAHLDDANKTDDASDVELEAAVAEPPVVDEPAEPNAEWAAAFARLTEPQPDPWAEAFAHLVNPQPSSSAATAAA